MATTQENKELKDQMYIYLDESVMQYPYNIKDLHIRERKEVLTLWQEVTQKYSEALQMVIDAMDPS